MQNVEVFKLAFVFSGLAVCVAVENLQAFIPQSGTENEPDTEFLLSFSNTKSSSSSTLSYNVVLRAPVEACPMERQLGIYQNCSDCNPDAFEPYRNVARTNVHNPYNLFDTTEYIRLDLCVENPIKIAYYVVVDCYHYAHMLKCENYNQSRCLYMRPSLIEKIRCPLTPSVRVDGIDQQHKVVSGGPQGISVSGGVGVGVGAGGLSNNLNPHQPPQHQDEQQHYVFESVKVSLFRFILSLLLLMLSGYAGCRWYARSSQRIRNTRRSNRILSDAFSRTFGVGGGVSSSSAGGGCAGTGLRNSSRSSMLFATNHSTNRSASSRRGTGGSLLRAARLSSPTRIVVVRQQPRSTTATQPYLSSTGAGGVTRSEIQQQYGSGGGGAAALNENCGSEGNAMAAEDESLDACMRVLIRSDPNFAVQFAKYYRSNNSPSNTAPPNTTNSPVSASNAVGGGGFAAPYSQSSSVLPSYQEAISAAASPPGPPASLHQSHQLPPPPPYSPTDPATHLTITHPRTTGPSPPPPFATLQSPPPVQLSECNENRGGTSSSASTETQDNTTLNSCPSSSCLLHYQPRPPPQLVAGLPPSSSSDAYSRAAEPTNHRSDGVPPQMEEETSVGSLSAEAPSFDSSRTSSINSSNIAQACCSSSQNSNQTTPDQNPRGG